MFALVQCWVVECTAPGCAWLRVYDDCAVAKRAAADARRKYGEQHVRAWEM